MEEKNKKDINRRDFIKIVGNQCSHIDRSAIRMLFKGDYFCK